MAAPRQYQRSPKLRDKLREVRDELVHAPESDDEIAVAGYNGAFSPQPFELRVKVDDAKRLAAKVPVALAGLGVLGVVARLLFSRKR